MRAASNDRRSLWAALNANTQLSARSISGATSNVNLSDLVRGRSLAARPSNCATDRSYSLYARSACPSALALIELDGIASRIVLYPPGLPATHLLISHCRRERRCHRRRSPNRSSAYSSIEFIASDPRLPTPISPAYRRTRIRHRMGTPHFGNDRPAEIDRAYADHFDWRNQREPSPCRWTSMEHFL